MNMPEQATGAGTPSSLHDVAADLRASLGLLYRRLKQTRVEGELTLPESSALSRIDRGGPVTAAALARIEQVSPQSIGATLQALETKGLIERAPDPGDGRRIILSPTAAGRKALRNKRAARTEQMTRALGTLTPEERERLVAALPVIERIAQAL